MDCKEAFYDYISNCNTSIQVNALLTPATPYNWLITDKFGKEYSGESITDGNGFLEIPVSDLPDGFLTPYSGQFSLKILADCRNEAFKMARYYEEIVFEVKDGTRVKANIGCDFDCVSAGGGPQNSAVFPFADVATLAIPWTSFLKGLYGETPQVQVYLQTAPNVYSLTTVAVDMVGGPYDLSEIDVDFGGNATGYVLVS